MKANELTSKDLMDGDRVQMNNGPAIVIKERDILFKDRFGKGIAPTCNPIPLTPEVLEKNGFAVESRDCHNEPLQYCELVDGLWIDISGENFFEGKLEYVHQLQHALRLCGIEKEIEL